LRLSTSNKVYAAADDDDVMCTLVQLARGGDSDAERLVDQYDWYIMPVVNPDGYSYTFTNVSIAHDCSVVVI